MPFFSNFKKMDVLFLPLVQSSQTKSNFPTPGNPRSYWQHTRGLSVLRSASLENCGGRRKRRVKSNLKSFHTLGNFHNLRSPSGTFMISGLQLPIFCTLNKQKSNTQVYLHFNLDNTVVHGKTPYYMTTAALIKKSKVSNRVDSRLALELPRFTTAFE